MNLIRNLLALVIVLTILPTSLSILNMAANIDFSYQEINDEIALSQLREILLISYEMNYNAEELSFIYGNRCCSLSKVNDHLVLQPGTQIFLEGIDELSFKEKNACLYVDYYRNGKEYERILCSKESLYLDEFSDCDVDSQQYSSQQE